MEGEKKRNKTFEKRKLFINVCIRVLDKIHELKESGEWDKIDYEETKNFKDILDLFYNECYGKFKEISENYARGILVDLDDVYRSLDNVYKNAKYKKEDGSYDKICNKLKGVTSQFNRGGKGGLEKAFENFINYDPNALENGNMNLTQDSAPSVATEKPTIVEAEKPTIVEAEKPTIVEAEDKDSAESGTEKENQIEGRVNMETVEFNKLVDELKNYLWKGVKYNDGGVVKSTKSGTYIYSTKYRIGDKKKDKISKQIDKAADVLKMKKGLNDADSKLVADRLKEIVENENSNRSPIWRVVVIPAGVAAAVVGVSLGLGLGIPLSQANAANAALSAENETLREGINSAYYEVFDEDAKDGLTAEGQLEAIKNVDVEEHTDDDLKPDDYTEVVDANTYYSQEIQDYNNFMASLTKALEDETISKEEYESLSNAISTTYAENDKKEYGWSSTESMKNALSNAYDQKESHTAEEIAKIGLYDTIHEAIAKAYEALNLEDAPEDPTDVDMLKAIQQSDQDKYDALVSGISTAYNSAYGNDAKENLTAEEQLTELGNLDYAKEVSYDTIHGAIVKAYEEINGENSSEGQTDSDMLKAIVAAQPTEDNSELYSAIETVYKKVLDEEDLLYGEDGSVDYVGMVNKLDVTDKIAGLEGQIEDLNADIDELYEAVRAVVNGESAEGYTPEKVKELLEGLVSDYDDKIEELKGQIEDLQGQVSGDSTLAAQITQLQSELKDLKADLATANQKISKLETENSSLQTQLDDANTKIGELEDDLEQLKSDLTAALASKTLTEQEKEALQTKYNTLLKSYNSLSSQYSTLSSKYNALVEEYNALLESNSATEEELAAAYAEIDEAQKAIAQIIGQENAVGELLEDIQTLLKALGLDNEYGNVNQGSQYGE